MMRTLFIMSLTLIIYTVGFTNNDIEDDERSKIIIIDLKNNFTNNSNDIFQSVNEKRFQNILITEFLEYGQDIFLYNREKINVSNDLTNIHEIQQFVLTNEQLSNINNNDISYIVIPYLDIEIETEKPTNIIYDYGWFRETFPDNISDQNNSQTDQSDFNIYQALTSGQSHLIEKIQISFTLYIHLYNNSGDLINSNSMYFETDHENEIYGTLYKVEKKIISIVDEYYNNANELKQQLQVDSIAGKSLTLSSIYSPTLINGMPLMNENKDALIRINNVDNKIRGAIVYGDIENGDILYESIPFLNTVGFFFTTVFKQGFSRNIEYRIVENNSAVFDIDGEGFNGLGISYEGRIGKRAKFYFDAGLFLSEKSNSLVFNAYPIFMDIGLGYELYAGRFIIIPNIQLSIVRTVLMLPTIQLSSFFININDVSLWYYLQTTYREINIGFKPEIKFRYVINRKINIALSGGYSFYPYTSYKLNLLSETISEDYRTTINNDNEYVKFYENGGEITPPFFDYSGFFGKIEICVNY